MARSLKHVFIKQIVAYSFTEVVTELANWCKDQYDLYIIDVTYEGDLVTAQVAGWENSSSRERYSV